MPLLVLYVAFLVPSAIYLAAEVSAYRRKPARRH